MCLAFMTFPPFFFFLTITPSFPKLNIFQPSDSFTRNVSQVKLTLQMKKSKCFTQDYPESSFLVHFKNV